MNKIIQLYDNLLQLQPGRYYLIMQMNKIIQLYSRGRFIAPTADLSARIGITLRKIPSNSVGARAVRSAYTGRFFRKGTSEGRGVILSAAKDLSPGTTQILSVAKDDSLWRPMRFKKPTRVRVRSGGVGLYGHPRPIHLASTLGEHDHSHLAGDHKGLPNPSSSTLAPTDRPASCLAFRPRLMPLTTDLSALGGWSAIQSILLKLIIAPRRLPCLK
jgi:hypothetical protein